MQAPPKDGDAKPEAPKTRRLAIEELVPALNEHVRAHHLLSTCINECYSSAGVPGDTACSSSPLLHSEEMLLCHLAADVLFIICS